MPPRSARGRSCNALELLCHGSFMQLMSTIQSVRLNGRTAPALLELSADNWRLAVLVGLVVSALAVVTLPASISFWIVGAMAALVAAAFVVNAYRRRYYGGLLVAPGHRRAIRDEHLSAAVVPGAFIFCLPVEPAVDPLRRPQQLHQGSDRRDRGAGQLERPHQHRHVRRCSRFRRR